MIVESYRPGTPSWVDLMTTDPDSAVAFYGRLFGWDVLVSGPEMGSYGMCILREQPVAGIGPIPATQQSPPAWGVYLSIGDADEVAAAATAAGGQVVAPVMEVAGDGHTQGRMAILADPAGAVFGIWEPHEHRGSGLANEPGSCAWHELLSRDPQASREFFGHVFGYEWQAMEGGPMEYHSALLDGREVLGVMAVPPDMPAQVPSYFNIYFAVADADAAARTAQEAGGSVLSGPFDSPFGRMAVLADPQGAAFSIVAMPDS